MILVTWHKYLNSDESNGGFQHKGDWITPYAQEQFIFKHFNI